MPTPDAVQDAARSWIGTPFHHQGRLKGVGCDCIGMVMGAAEEAGLLSRHRGNDGKRLAFSLFDTISYAPDPSSERLKERLDAHLDAVPLAELAPGDVLLFRIVRLPQHVGVVSRHPAPGGGLGLIHAYAPVGRVVENRLSSSWISRVIAAYRFPPECFMEG